MKDYGLESCPTYLCPPHTALWNSALNIKSQKLSFWSKAHCAHLHKNLCSILWLPYCQNKALFLIEVWRYCLRTFPSSCKLANSIFQSLKFQIRSQSSGSLYQEMENNICSSFCAVSFFGLFGVL